MNRNVNLYCHTSYFLNKNKPTMPKTNGHQTTAAQRSLGLKITEQSQAIILGHRPQVLPKAFLHSQKVVVNLLHCASRCSAQFSFLSRITPRYFTDRAALSLFPQKTTSSVFSAFTDSPDSLHQSSTIRRAHLVKPINVSRWVPLNRITKSSAQP